MSLDGIADAPAGAGAEEWLALSDELLAGLVHGLNNRVAALSACSELAALGDSQMLQDGMLATEVERLQRASALFALLPARDRPAEALDLAPVLEDAMLLHAHHPRVPAIEGVLERQGMVYAVRAPRWALVRLLVLLVDAAKTTAQDARADRFELTVTGGDDTVRVWCRARRPGLTYAAHVAALCGATLVSEGDRLVLTLPSLQETRRRERRARDGGV
jgi:hypothetical protein